MNTLSREFLDSYGLSYDCRRDFLDAMDRLKTLKVDIFLGNHAYQNHTTERYQQLLSGNTDAFVDPTAWSEFAESARQDLLQLIEREKENI